MNRNVPKLRFKGFTEDWEQRKLGDVAQEFKSGNSLKADEIDITGDYPVYGGNGLRGYTPTYNHDGEYALIGRQGALCGNMNYSVGKAYFTEHAVVVEADENNDTRFLYYMLDTMNLGQYSDQSAQPGLAVNKLIKLVNRFPTKEEQQRIGRYFSNIDHLITLHQRKCDSLKKYKKGMLQKMFPKNGEKVPEIRFPGFTEDWEQRKLGDITESYSGGTPTASKKEYYGGNIPFIRSGEISNDKTELFISEEGLNNSSAKMVKTGDILYALYGATSGEVSISKLKGAINQAILAIQPHQNYDSQFLMQWLRKSKENIIGTYLQGGQGNLSGNIVKELIIDIPAYEEQKEIGAYLKNLDNLITLHQRKCEKIKELKKGLLQQMFI